MLKQEIEKIIEKVLIKTELKEFLRVDIRKPYREDFGYLSAILSGDRNTDKGIGFEVDIVRGKNPMQKIVDNIESSEIFDFEFKFPRYINFFLRPEYFLENLRDILKKKEKYGQGPAQLGKGKTIVIDYSGPNIAKPFGIGHLRSTIIGQSIYNLYKFLGYKTIGDNHLGDWGTQFGKLISRIELKVQNEKLKISDLTISDLEKLYVEFHKEAGNNPVLEDEARVWFKKLEDGDKEARKVWQVCKEISLKEFDRIYNLLGIEIDNALGESFYQDKMKPVFEETKQKGLTRQSEGAWVVEFENDELPSLVLMKSDGATTYFLRDLATIKYRLKKWKPNIIAYEVGCDQSLYFKQLFKTVEMLGWLKGEKLVHVVHGLMRSKTGKFSTRRGDTIHLEDVLQEAIDKAAELSGEDNKELAKQVGIGAVKYNDLSQHHSRDIVFDWDKILNLKGNSGPYLQYAFARCQSVLEKAGQRPKMPKVNFNELQEIEKIILKKLLHFSEVVEQAAISFSPNLICNYVFDLAQSFNLFYNEAPILKADTKEQKEFRLALTLAVGQVIKNSLTLLGIESPSRM